MSPIAGQRVVEGFGGHFTGMDRQHRNPTNGRQGKSAGSGRAQAVGWLGDYRHLLRRPCCRLRPKHQEFQGSERRRLSQRREKHP